MTSQDYQKAVDWLFVQTPNYQIDGEKAYKPGLGNIKKLCDFFGNPQDKIKTIFFHHNKNGLYAQKLWQISYTQISVK